jgi:hypothetical protein
VNWRGRHLIKKPKDQRDTEIHQQTSRRGETEQRERKGNRETLALCPAGRRRLSTDAIAKEDEKHSRSNARTLRTPPLQPDPLFRVRKASQHPREKLFQPRMFAPGTGENTASGGGAGAAKAETQSTENKKKRGALSW